jgi:hypothetical protein
METPLPERLPISFQQYTDNSVRLTINQLITYLAELTAVVEKHQAQITNLRGGYTDAEIAAVALKPTPTLNPHDVKASLCSTPTLKETLLDAITSESFQEHGLQKMRRVMLSDVEAIINRLMP